MTITLHVPHTLRKSRSTSGTGFGDSKAHHVLGLSEAEIQSARKHSFSSSATSRGNGSSFSQATTAPVLRVNAIGSSKDGAPVLPQLDLKASSLLLREDYGQEIATGLTTTTNEGGLKGQTSNSTLNSFYDRTKAPLSVSQQTSESSTRDFALRKGTPSVITSTSQEMEHAKQLQLLTSNNNHKRIGSKSNPTRSPARPSTVGSRVSAENSGKSLKSEMVSIEELRDPSSLSVGNVSIGSTKVRNVHTPSKDTKTTRKSPQHFAPIKPADETPQIKIHVRRPKAGTKHWFDSFDDDLSDEDEEIVNEPQLHTNFVHDVEDAFENNRIGREKQGRVSEQANARQLSESLLNTPQRAVSTPSRGRTTNFAPRSSSLNAQNRVPTGDSLFTVNLNVQSALNLSSDDEDDVHLPQMKKAIDATTHSRESSSSCIYDDSEVEIGLARAVNAQSRATFAPPKRSDRVGSTSSVLLQVPSRTSSRNASRPASIIGTYLSATTYERVKGLSNPVAPPRSMPIEQECKNDQSPKMSQTLTNPGEQDSNWPLFSHSTQDRDSALSHKSHADSDTSSERQRDSIVTDSGQSIMSTRVMTVTKQEQNLIAAMRLKRAAMRRAEEQANRQGALRLLELGGAQRLRELEASRPKSSYVNVPSRTIVTHDHGDIHIKSAHRRSLSGDAGFRSGSGTTFQSSVTDRSSRDSQATFVTDHSDDLQLPYSAYTTSAAALIPASLRIPEPLQARARDTQHSPIMDASARRRAIHRHTDTLLSQGSHIVTLDCLDRQLLREEIPSQLFMERPFLGWEARANLQMAAH